MKNAVTTYDCQPLHRYEHLMHIHGCKKKIFQYISIIVL